MKEEFLHFIWKNRLFGEVPPVTISGYQLEIIEPGDYNRDAGPDFFNSRIKLGQTEWAGNVEMHINASDWFRHRHNLDHGYDNVILHVVVNNDLEVKTASGLIPETYIISWDKNVEERYLDLLNNSCVIACRDIIRQIPPFSIRHWISRIAIERIEEKITRLREVLKSTGNNWDETLYRLLARYFGLKVNSAPFYLLACHLPLRIIRKHADNRLQVECLFYGQAGMLEPGVFENEILDDYYLDLQKEYKVLRQKYSLRPVDSWLWKYHRLRPANFPTIRISQLAGLLCTGKSMFSEVKSCRSIDELSRLFISQASDYWNNHYVFGHYKRGRVKKTGGIMLNLLLINMVIPLLFLYGRETGKHEYCTAAADLLDEIPPEENRIIREWFEAGIIPCSALESQGLLHLREKYCKNRLCLHCQCGSKLISLGQDINPQSRYLLE